jgi:hypothetical protein
MSSCDLESTNVQNLAERGLSSFLRAVGEDAPDKDLQTAGDCWIRAIETTDWIPGESTDRFIRRVTIHALAIDAGPIKSEMPAAQLF